jgi:hypothetical protein
MPFLVFVNVVLSSDLVWRSFVPWVPLLTSRLVLVLLFLLLLLLLLVCTALAAP